MGSTSRIRRSAAAIATLLALSACGGGGTQDSADCAPGQTDGDLYLYNWNDYIDPEMVADFEAEFGVSIVQDYFTSNEELLARVLAGGAAYDVIVPSDYMVELMIEEGLLLPLTRTAVPNLVNVEDGFADPPYDPGLAYSAPYLWGTTGLGVNVELLGDVEPSWALVFDPAVAGTLPGRVLLLDDPRETLGAALYYLGFSPNTTDEAELQAAADVIAAARSWTAAYNSDLYGEYLLSGEVVVSHGYSGNMIDAIGDDERFEYMIPLEGATIWTDNMAILANAQHPCTAHTFIDFVLRPEQGARLTNLIYYASPNALAAPFIDPEILDDPVIYPSDELRERLQFLVDTGEFETLYTDLYTRATN